VEFFFKKKHWAWLMKMTNQIRVDRDAKDKTASIVEVEKILKNGGVVGIFPEGTRSPSGLLQKAYNGVGRMAVDLNVPIIPIGLIGNFQIMSRFDSLPKLKKISVIRYGNLMLPEGDQYSLTFKVMKNIASLIGENYDY
jgi:1-acyl-sn-glycerol-3-phosphate acyltransferase